MEELEVFVNKHNIDIIAICETLPKNSLDDKNDYVFNLPDYKPINKSEGRGVCLFVKNNIDCVQLSEPEQIFKPSIFCKILTNNNDFLIFGLVYRSEDKCTDTENENLNKQIDFIMQKYSKNKVIIVGDFNYPDIEWEHDHCNKSPEHKSSKFLETINDNFLTQCVTEPTHHKPNTTPSLIDLIICNDPDFIDKVDHSPPLGKSHHSILSFNLPIGIPDTQNPPVLKYQVNKGDYVQMRKHVGEVDWDNKFENANDATDMVNILDNVMNEAKDIFIPKKIHKNNFTKRTFSAPLTLLLRIKLKRAAFKTYKRFPTQSNYNEYVRLRNEVNTAVKKAKKERELQIAREVKSNPKAFYQYVSAKTKTKEGVSNLTKEDGSLTLNNKEKAQVLSNFFSSVFTKDNKDIPIPEFKADVKDFLTNINITKNDITKSLKSLKICKSPGPDNMHPRVLRELAHELSYPLLLIFNKSMSQGKIPTQWKPAEVRPIFKKGCKSTPGNYRPVSLTSILCKVFEGFVRDALYKHLIKNNLLSAKQFGFCQGRSCVTQLLTTINKWMKCIDDNKPVDAIYLDFAKAFDTVPHKRLIKKLEGYGVHDNVLKWIEDFLSDRTQYVSVNGERSNSMPVTSGVPQGSVLGPVLFIYFINDMPNVTKEDMNLFADDAKAFNDILSLIDRDDLQCCINALVKWSIIWGMGFNACKCKVMHLGKTNPKYTYTMSNGTTTSILEETTCEKDLGVHVDNMLSFDEHILLTTKKARRAAGLLLRSISHKIPNILTPLFKSLVRPILEYGNAVWAPHKRKNIDLLEKVQRSFTKRMFSLSGLSYTQRLERLGLPSLEFRRIRGDLIETYKLLQEIYDPLTTKELLNVNNSSTTRGHNFKLLKNAPRLNTYKYFFTNRVTNLWNQLPSHIVNASSVNCFKNKIDRLLHSYKFKTNIDIFSMKVPAEA